MSIGSISPADKAKLQSMINDGVKVLEEVATLKEGLKDTVSSIAEELDIKPSVLNKSIRIAYKANLNKDELKDSREELDEVEEILFAAGKK